MFLAYSTQATSPYFYRLPVWLHSSRHCSYHLDLLLKDSANRTAQSRNAGKSTLLYTNKNKHIITRALSSIFPPHLIQDPYFNFSEHSFGDKVYTKQSLSGRLLWVRIKNIKNNNNKTGPDEHLEQLQSITSVKIMCILVNL